MVASNHAIGTRSHVYPAIFTIIPGLRPPQIGQPHLHDGATNVQQELLHIDLVFRLSHCYEYFGCLLEGDKRQIDRRRVVFSCKIDPPPRGRNANIRGADVTGIGSVALLPQDLHHFAHDDLEEGDVLEDKPLRLVSAYVAEHTA